MLTHASQLVILNGSTFLRPWHVWALKLQTERSAFQTNKKKPSQNDKRHRSVEKRLVGSALALLIRVGQQSGACGWTLFARDS